MDLILSTADRIDKWVLAIGVFIAYLGYVRYRRYEYVHSIIKEYPDPDVVLKDHDVAIKLFSHVFRREFPLLSRTSLEFALFKPFAVPSVSKLLVSTREFLDRCPRRAEDSELILSEILDPYPRIQNQLRVDPHIDQNQIDQQYQRSEDSLKRLNEIHGKYPISNDDYLYSLVLFVVEPIRWLNQWEWRPLDIREINAIFKVWYDIGVKMNIKDIPGTLEEWVQLQKNYELTAVKYHPANRSCADPTIQYLTSRVPPFLSPLIHRTVPCLLEPSEIMAFKMEEPPLWIQMVFHSVIWIRALFLRYLCLPRTSFDIRTPFTASKGKYIPTSFVCHPPIYGDGYRIEELGPEKFIRKCPAMK
ncbi:hypothetical protein BDB01DRAFT_861931 [Pilobolus umbonatus]|nr:hypothetical protein BDB01DRAFT_861931 [Pilobolus umbonatus]